MRKLILMMLSVWMIGGMASAQSRWSLTPEAGMTAVQRVGYGTWKPGLKVGASIGYQFKPEWIGLKAGLFYTNRGYSMGDYPVTSQYLDGTTTFELIGGSITQHFLQLPVMADFSWKVGDKVRMHLGVGMYAGVSLSNHWKWGSSMTTVSKPDPGVEQRMISYPYPYPGGNYEMAYDTNPFGGQSSFDWGLTTSFGIEVDNWIINVGYELSLGDEGDSYMVRGDNFSFMDDRSVGSNYNTLSLSVGYKFKLGK